MADPCIDKFKNNPSLSNYDQQAFKVIPSNLAGLSQKTKQVKIGDMFKAAAKEIKAQVETLVKNSIAAITGNLTATLGQAKTLADNLKNLPSSFVKAIKGVTDTLAAQAKAIGALVECEIKTSSTALRDVFENSDVQANITQSTQNAITNITNANAKELSEQPEKLNEYVNKQYDKAVAENSALLQMQKSISEIVQEEGEAVNKLATLA